VSDEQFLTSPFLPRFHLFSHKLKFFLRSPPGPLRTPGPGALAPATPPPLGGPAWRHYSGKYIGRRSTMNPKLI